MYFVKTFCVLISFIAYVMAIPTIDLGPNKLSRATVFAISPKQGKLIKWTPVIPLVFVKSSDGKYKVIIDTSYLTSDLEPGFEFYGVSKNGDTAISMKTKTTLNNAAEGVTIVEVEDAESNQLEAADFNYAKASNFLLSSSDVIEDLGTLVAVYYMMNNNSAKLMKVQLGKITRSLRTNVFIGDTADAIPRGAAIFVMGESLFVGIMTAPNPEKHEFVVFGEDFLTRSSINGSPNL